MMRWFKNLFGKKPVKNIPTITADDVDDDDDFFCEVVARAWNSGKTVTGTVDEDGKLKIEGD